MRTSGWGVGGWRGEVWRARGDDFGFSEEGCSELDDLLGDL